MTEHVSIALWDIHIVAGHKHTVALQINKVVVHPCSGTAHLYSGTTIEWTHWRACQSRRPHPHPPPDLVNKGRFLHLGRPGGRRLNWAEIYDGLCGGVLIGASDSSHPAALLPRHHFIEASPQNIENWQKPLLIELYMVDRPGGGGVSQEGGWECYL